VLADKDERIRDAVQGHGQPPALSSEHLLIVLQLFPVFLECRHRFIPSLTS
jgi:hypothetical protein